MTAAIPEEAMAKINAKIPFGAMGTPEDISNAVLFLAKDESRYITGETLSVNGGLYMH
ncbi:MAG: SDR family oxidoreductase, partial [Clostridia bacterium]|nr:SDR family oxidoreductase [Clostridia bacterium]